MFHKGVMGLPWMAKNPRSTGDVPDGVLHRADRRGQGRAARARDATVVTLSLSVHHALDVADTLAAQGVEVEVIDLRSLVPLDRGTILESVAKTGRLVVVDEDYQSFGLSGEVAATITDVDPGMLRAPIVRVANPDVPVPYAHSLEYAVLPRQDRIEAGDPARRLPMTEVLFPALSKESADGRGRGGDVVRRARASACTPTSCSPRCRSTRWPPRSRHRATAPCTCW